MKNLFIEYPKCSTCQKAKKWLVSHNVPFQERHIIEERPSVQELSQWIRKSGLEIKRFFNTSGLKYRQLQLKDKIPNLSQEELLNILASDGMLVKRPIFLTQQSVLVGFDPTKWEKELCKEDEK